MILSQMMKYKMLSKLCLWTMPQMVSMEFFYKKCWHLILPSFRRLCVDFCQGSANLVPINSSYITLIPKKPDPEVVNDYRPISLLNCLVKLLTKILAKRLQSIITEVVHLHQFGFIRGRSIQDCLAWVSFCTFVISPKKRCLFSNWILRKRLIRSSTQLFCKYCSTKDFHRDGYNGFTRFFLWGPLQSY